MPTTLEFGKTVFKNRILPIGLQLPDVKFGYSGRQGSNYTLALLGGKPAKIN